MVHRLQLIWLVHVPTWKAVGYDEGLTRGLKLSEQNENQTQVH